MTDGTTAIQVSPVNFGDESMTRSLMAQIADHLVGASNLASQVEALTSQVNTLREQFTALQQDMAGAVEARDRAYSDRDQALAERDRLRHENETLRAEIDTLRSRLADCSQSRETLQHDYNGVSQTLEVARRDVEHWQGLANGRGETIDTLRSQIGSLEDRLENCNGKGRDMSDRLEAISRIIGDFGKQAVVEAQPTAEIVPQPSIEAVSMPDYEAGFNRAG